MKAYPQRRTTITRNAWLAAALANRRQRIAGVTLHSTRGNSTLPNEGPATENWGANPTNRGKNKDGSWAWWGSYEDLIVFDTGERVEMTFWDKEYPTYGAGYAATGGWCMSMEYLQVEIAQPTPSTPFDRRSIESAAEFTAWAAHTWGFPLVRLPYLSQYEQPVPRGISSHDACANGTAYQKSDVGSQFPWTEFLSLCQQYYEGDDDMAEYATKAEFDAFKAETEKRYKDDHGWIQKHEDRLTIVENRLNAVDLVNADQGKRIHTLEEDVAQLRADVNAEADHNDR